MEGAQKNPHLQKVDFAISNNRTLNIKTYKYLSIERDFIDGVIAKYLNSLGLSWLNNKLSYCIHELAANAHKANTKRVYFESMGLDIADPDAYEQGMRDFKAETFQNLDSYLNEQRRAGLYVIFQFQLSSNRLSIQIRNNTPTTAQEEERICDKLRIARLYDNLADAYDDSEDYSEGAGLGIVMLSLMLNTLGFGQEAISFEFTEEETIAHLELCVDENQACAEDEVEEQELYA